MSLNGSLVETWKDKSNNSRDFTAASTARPTLTSNAINSRSAVTFAGSPNTMTGNTAAQDVIRNLAWYTVFTVLRTATVAAGERLAIGVGATVLFRTGQTDSRPFIGGRRVGGDTLESVTGTAGELTAGTTFIQTAVVNHTSQSLTGLRNGAVFASDTTYMAAGSSDNVASTVTVGSQPGGYGFWNGEIAEVIVYNTALSTAQRASVEAYLASKWGISGVHAPATASSDPVGYWADKSGNGRHATQSTAGSRPTISATLQNGKKQIALTSTQGNCLATQSLALDAPYSLLAVVSSSARRVGAFAGSLISNTQFGDGSATYSGAYYGAIRIGGAVYGSAPIATGRAQVFSAVASVGSLPSSLSMFSDGIGGQSAVVFAGTAPNNTLGGPLQVGSSATSSWGGTICEMIAYSKALSTSERQRLERYLAAKYGITLAPQVSNLDAQDWISRVYANGGTLSSSTAAAVNQFCLDIENAPGG
jgi:hypothetical protein